MRNVRVVVLLTGLVCLPSLAFADSVFDIEGNLSIRNGNGSIVGTFSGTIDMNTITGQILNWSVAMPNLTAVGGTAAHTFTPFNSALCCSPPVMGVFGFTGFASQNFVSFYLGNVPLVGFTGATFGFGYPITSEYLGAIGTAFFSTSGTIERSLSSPEPSTLILMGSGLVGILGWRRVLSFGR